VIRVLSDLHLGHPATRLKSARALQPVIEGCERVIFNGDSWEERSLSMSKEGEVQITALKKMLDDCGVEGQFLHGNHDPGWEKGYCVEDQIVITHGDAVLREASPWSREMPHYRKEIDELIEGWPEAETDLAQRVERAREIGLLLRPKKLPALPVPLNFFATVLWPPSRLSSMVRVWATLGKEGLHFLETFAPEAKVLITGHFHRAGAWEREGRVYLNTGSFMKMDKPFVVELSAGEVRFCPLREQGDEFVLGPVSRRWKTV